MLTLALFFVWCLYLYSRLLAVGLENGDILIHVSSTTDTSKWELVTSKYVQEAPPRSPLTFSRTQWHVGQLEQLSWRPSPPVGAGHQLASCSEDGTLRILCVRDR